MLKKKFLYLFMFLFVIFGLVSCKDNTDTPNDGETPGIEQPEEPTNEVNIIILCGQSNAEGHTWWIEMQKKNPQLYNKYLNKQDSYLKMLYHCDNGRHKNEDYESVKFGMGYDKNRFGPEIGMNEVLSSAELKRETYIIKYTVGATDLYYQWRSPSSGTPGALYNSMLLYLFEQLGALEEAGKVPYVKAICWMQGEADSQQDVKTQSYGEYLDNFINDLNDELVDYVEETDEKIKFIDAGISESNAWKNYIQVNQAKLDTQALDPDNRAFIDTIGLGLDWRTEPAGAPDVFHYDCLSMIELGKQFAEEILKFNVLK